MQDLQLRADGVSRARPGAWASSARRDTAGCAGPPEGIWCDNCPQSYSRKKWRSATRRCSSSWRSSSSPRRCSGRDITCLGSSAAGGESDSGVRGCVNCARSSGMRTRSAPDSGQARAPRYACGAGRYSSSGSACFAGCSRCIDQANLKYRAAEVFFAGSDPVSAAVLCTRDWWSRSLLAPADCRCWSDFCRSRSFFGSVASD